MKTALMSIRQPYADAIFEGSKRYEYRTRRPSFEGPTRVLVYVPGPSGRVVGEMIVDGILSGTPQGLWKRTSTEAGIERETYLSYFAGRDKAFALKIRSVRRWKDQPDLHTLRKDLGSAFRPPQYFMWVEDSEWAAYLT